MKFVNDPKWHKNALFCQGSTLTKSLTSQVFSFFFIDKDRELMLKENPVLISAC